MNAFNTLLFGGGHEPYKWIVSALTGNTNVKELGVFKNYTEALTCKVNAPEKLKKDITIELWYMEGKRPVHFMGDDIKDIKIHFLFI